MLPPGKIGVTTLRANAQMFPIPGRHPLRIARLEKDAANPGDFFGIITHGFSNSQFLCPGQRFFATKNGARGIQKPDEISVNEVKKGWLSGKYNRKSLTLSGFFRKHYRKFFYVRKKR